MIFLFGGPKSQSFYNVVRVVRRSQNFKNFMSYLQKFDVQLGYIQYQPCLLVLKSLRLWQDGQKIHHVVYWQNSTSSYIMANSC